MQPIEQLYRRFEHLYNDCPEYSVEYLTDILSGCQVEFKDGMFQCANKKTHYKNVKKNIRTTVFHKINTKNSIFLIGSSIPLCSYSDDSRTVGSVLQAHVNDGWLSYTVENHGVDGLPYENHFLKTTSLAIIPGDIVVLLDYSRKFSDSHRAYILAIHHMCRQKGARFLFAVTPRVADMRHPSQWERTIGNLRTGQIARLEVLPPPPSRCIQTTYKLFSMI